MKQFIFIIAALLGIGCMLNAQQTVGVTTDSLRIERNGEYIVVDMNMGLSPLEVDINRAVLLTPRFVCATDTLELPSIGVYGRQRYYYYVRNGESMLSGAKEMSFKARSKPSDVAYHAIIPYYGWMNGAALELYRSDYGCCNTLLAECVEPLGGYMEVLPLSPQLLYVYPQAEAVKSRSLSGSAFIDFPVNKTVIYPEYRRNTHELGKIQASIDSVRNDKDLTTASLPFVQLDSVLGAVGSRVLLTRIVSDTPLPQGEGNEEMRDAVLQNSLREYDFYDPATNTIEKVFDEPYYPEERNERKGYLGYCGDKLYFGVTYTDSAAAFSTRNTLVSYDRTAGTWQEECSADSKGGEYSNFWPLLQDGQLRLVVLWRGTDTLTLYSIDNGARYEVPYEEAGSDATGNRNFPIALTDDGRILVTDGYIDRSGMAASRYALIDLGAYLAGSREYTAVEMWTE